jgi:cytochrome c553
MKISIFIVAIIAASVGPSLRGADANQNWSAQCLKCHGADGKGQTKMGKQLAVKDLTDPKVQAAFTDAQAAKAIKEGIKEGGKTKMKPLGGVLSDGDTKALVAYVRSLKK